MSQSTSAIWKVAFPGLRQVLTATINAAVTKANTQTRVYFRADDIDDADEMFTPVMQLFMRFDVPLALAVVPGWLTEEKWGRLHKVCGRRPDLWCWHQHGWQHANHETEGKKQEFGPGRTSQAIRDDLVRGRAHLIQIMGETFCPVFTPPWNRCSPETLQQLSQCGFMAVSRDRGAEPTSPPGLPDLRVHVDLHTRKEPDPASARQALINEIQVALSEGRCGFMLHHHRMNDNAFNFLECLLQTVSEHPRLKAVGFKEMIGDNVSEDQR